MTYYDPENPIIPLIPKRNSLDIHIEMKSVQDQIGKLQYKLMMLQQELNNSYSREYGKYTCEKGDGYIMFNNGSELQAIKSDDVARGKGWFVGVDLAREESTKG